MLKRMGYAGYCAPILQPSLFLGLAYFSRDNSPTFPFLRIGLFLKSITLISNFSYGVDLSGASFATNTSLVSLLCSCFVISPFKTADDRTKPILNVAKVAGKVGRSKSGHSTWAARIGYYAVFYS